MCPARNLNAMLVSLMVSGQEDVTWDDWLALARAAEESGVEGLFRSDHHLGDEREVGDDVEPRTVQEGRSTHGRPSPVSLR